MRASEALARVLLPEEIGFVLRQPGPKVTTMSGQLFSSSHGVRLISATRTSQEGATLPAQVSDGSSFQFAGCPAWTHSALDPWAASITIVIEEGQTGERWTYAFSDPLWDDNKGVGDESDPIPDPVNKWISKTCLTKSA